MLPTYRQAAQEVHLEEGSDYLASNTAHFIYEFEPNELDKPLFRELLYLMVYEHTDPLHEQLDTTNYILRRNTAYLAVTTIVNILLVIGLIITITTGIKI